MNPLIADITFTNLLRFYKSKLADLEWGKAHGTDVKIMLEILFHFFEGRGGGF